MEKNNPINLDTRPFGEAYPELVKPVPVINSDLGKIYEVSNEEIEVKLPVWVVETNRHEDELALQSLQYAVRATR